MYAVLFDKTNVPVRTQPHMDAFDKIMGNQRFPCFFARDAYLKNELLYGHCSFKDGMEAIKSLFDACVNVINKNREQTIILWIDDTKTSSLQEDYAFTATLMNYLLTQDPEGWPENATTNPNSPHWDFWYGGIDFFINVSTPNHHKRKSRNLGKAYTLVVQSRTSFDIVEERVGSSRKIIRKRIDRYDDCLHSPALGEHGEHSEIDQFFLGDSNDMQISRCPLTTQKQIDSIQAERKNANTR